MGTASVDARQRAGMPSQQVMPPSPWLQILPRNLWNRNKDGFVYHLDFVTVGNAAVPLPVNITADPDFVIVYGTRIATAADNTTFIANVPATVNIVDTGAGRALSSAAVHSDEWFGTAQLPAYWAFPKFMRAASTLSVTVNSLEATVRNIRLSFHGFKVFGKQAGAS